MPDAQQRLEDSENFALQVTCVAASVVDQGGLMSDFTVHDTESSCLGNSEDSLSHIPVWKDVYTMDAFDNAKADNSNWSFCRDGFMLVP